MADHLVADHAGHEHPVDDLWVVLPHLGAGGAQKVGLLAADHFARQGLRVRVLSLRPEHPVKHRLPQNVSMLDMEHYPGEKLVHPWLRDVWDRSLVARARRFSVAQWIKLRRLVIRVVTAIVLRAIQLALPWLDSHLHPGSTDWPSRLLSRCMASVGGLRYCRLRELLVEHRPRRVLALLTKTNILCCAAAWDLPIHVVVSERNDPRLQSMDRLWRRLRTIYYRRADVVTANTEGVLEALRGMGTWQRLELLPNPLPADVLERDPSEPSLQHKEILAVARLVPQKGLDLLIRGFAALPATVRDGWRLTLVGDGPERETLEQLVTREGLGDSVVFEGFRSDPFTFMDRASIFALPSRFEGMPNALLEAMAAGLPSVVSDASPGPLEMVSDGEHGLVVPTENHRAFAEALQRLMGDPDLRVRCGEAARTKLRNLDWPVVEPHWRSVLALPAA